MIELAKLRTFPDPSLRLKAKEADPKDPALNTLVARMFYRFTEENALGLAAPQIGASTRVVLLRDDSGSPMIFLNPKIVSSEGEETAPERCLSLPGLEVHIPRFQKIEVFALDIEGGEHNILLEGLAARIMQHEIDHLQGKMIIDFAEPHYLASLSVHR